MRLRELAPALDGTHLGLELCHDGGALGAEGVHALCVLLPQHLQLVLQLRLLR